MQKTLIIAALGSFIFLGTVYAGPNDSINIHAAPDEKLGSFHAVEIQVIELDHQSLYDAAKLEVDLIHELRNKNIFSSVNSAASSSAKADLFIKISFNKFVRVETYTQGTHGLLSAAFDEKGQISFTMDLISARNGSIGVQKFDAIAKEGSLTSNDAILQAVKLISNYIQTNI